MSRIALTTIALLAVACICLSPAASGTSASAPPDWLNSPQTYTMVPLLPETAAQLHASVNGVWGGAGGIHPILSPHETVATVDALFRTNPVGFVQACHQAGLRVFGMISGLEGWDSMRATLPNLDEMACRNAKGDPARVDGMTLMCTNNPAWMQWRIDQGKRAIDLGADAIQLDTPMASSFESGFLRAGFCPYCMANFRRYLYRRFTSAQLASKFELNDWDPQSVIARLSPLQDLSDPKRRPHSNTGMDDLLFREFIDCQEQASFDSCKRLTDALRAYAAARKRKVAISANASDLGTVNPGGHWIRAMMFADLVDYFAYELNAEPEGMPSDALSRYPRGRWAPYHRLAYAIHHRRSPAVIHASSMGGLLKEVITTGRSINTWMEVQSAEAYAAGGAYIQYCVQPPAFRGLMLEECCSGTARNAAFIRSHPDLYTGELRSCSSLAILFLLNERGRTIPAVYPSYLGFSQALTEGNYPLDVLFGGDGRYVRDRVSQRGLSPYRALLVPSPIQPTENQRRVIRSFVKAGGTLVCQEPAKLGFPDGADTKRADWPSCVKSGYTYGRGRVYLLRGSVTRTWTDDAGSNFHRTYLPSLRHEIGSLAESLGIAPLIAGDADGLVTAFPIVQAHPRRVVVHLVNCDIDYEKDAIRRKSGLVMRLPRADFRTGNVVARICAPGEPTRELGVRVSKDVVSVSLPVLDVCAVVVVSEQAHGRQR